MLMVVNIVPKVFIMLPLMILLLLGAVGLIVLAVKLFKKQPWVAAVVGIVLLLGLSFFFLMPAVAYRSVETVHGTQHVRAVGAGMAFIPIMLIGAMVLVGIIVLLVKFGKKQPWVAAIAGLLLLVLPVFWLRFSGMQVARDVAYEAAGTAAIVAEPDVAIWTPGIEDEFEASVYPSKVAAIRSLGLRISKPIFNVLGDGVLPSRVVLFPGSNERSLVDQLGSAISQTLGGIQWVVEPETAAVEANEVAVRLDMIDFERQTAPWSLWSEEAVGKGTLGASVLSGNKQASIKAEFVEKPWVQDISNFLNRKPGGRLEVAKSADSCMSEGEANRQAVQSACEKLTELLRQQSPQRLASSLTMQVNSDDLVQSNLILDRFVQNFNGSAGKIWRQALLLDVSPAKIRDLADRKMLMMRAVKYTWAKMLGSICGLLVLIVIVYAFLNAATKGYYTWSLRIAGVVLAVVIIMFFLV